MWLVEAKAGRTVSPAMAAPMQRPLPRLGDRAAGALLVHRRDARAAATAALAEGVAADGFELLADIAGKARRRR